MTESKTTDSKVARTGAAADDDVPEGHAPTAHSPTDNVLTDTRNYQARELAARADDSTYRSGERRDPEYRAGPEGSGDVAAPGSTKTPAEAALMAEGITTPTPPEHVPSSSPTADSGYNRSDEDRNGVNAENPGAIDS